MAVLAALVAATVVAEAGQAVLGWTATMATQVQVHVAAALLSYRRWSHLVRHWQRPQPDDMPYS